MTIDDGSQQRREHDVGKKSELARAIAKIDDEIEQLATIKRMIQGLKVEVAPTPRKPRLKGVIGEG